MGVELMCVCFLGKVRIKRKRKVETKIVVKNKYIRVESRNLRNRQSQMVNEQR